MASYTPDIHGAAATYTPPPPPPKPGSHSHDATRISTPTPPSGFVTGHGHRGSRVLAASPSPPSGSPAAGPYANPPIPQYDGGHAPPPFPGAGEDAAQAAKLEDPGDHWLPQILQDKSKQDLAAILASPALLNALTHSPETIHPSLTASHTSLQSALSSNIDLAAHLADLESRLAGQRAATQAQLLSTHALDRQWRAKQGELDHVLAPFAPSSLYQRVSQGVQEQGGVCQALEESFLEEGGEGTGAATEREVSDWVRRYREARVLYYLRQERKERWDEGRVGGWR